MAYEVELKVIPREITLKANINVTKNLFLSKITTLFFVTEYFRNTYLNRSFEVQNFNFFKNNYLNSYVIILCVGLEGYFFKEYS